jgi:hypothetical protein
MPAPPVEICGNCVDDDGNGLTDFEDPACCPFTFESTVTSGRLVPAEVASAVNLCSTLNAVPDQLPSPWPGTDDASPRRARYRRRRCSPAAGGRRKVFTPRSDGSPRVHGWASGCPE